MTPRTAVGERAVVVLCGFMGTGKSVVGRSLATLLGVEFVDTDAVIEEREGVSVAAIFDKRGEAHFRALEHDACQALDPRDGAVIATGGGMVMDRANLLHLQSLGTTVLLEASVDAIIARTGGGGDRPLLSVADAVTSGTISHRVQSLLDARASVYEQCELRLDTTARTPDESAFDVMEMVAAHRARGDDGTRALIPLRVDTRPLPGRQPHPGNTRLCRVVVGRGVSLELGEWLERLDLLTSGVFFLAPAHIAALALPRITPSLDVRSVPWRTIHVDDGDESKTMEQVTRITGELANAGAGRDSVAVTLGGGVTGDLGGFAASIYMRGLPFVQMPTSLLAQVDASIGGKVGVNHARAKNLIGAMYQPHLVLTDPALLDTLPEREFSNGMAEVIKTAIIGDARLFERLTEDPRPAIDRVVAACARVKADVVGRDPFERDLRRVLNLGHTLGHALEIASSHALAHGEAVGLGLLAAWRIAVVRGVADGTWLERTREMLGRFGLPTAVPEVDETALRTALELDKKRRDGRLTFVLPIRPGRVEVVDDVGEDELMAALRD